MPDAVEMRVIAVIDPADDAGVGLGLVGADHDLPMPPNRFDRLAQKGPASFRVPPRGQAKIDHLAIRIEFASTARHTE